jgi:hypothetical protein
MPTDEHPELALVEGEPQGGDTPAEPLYGQPLYGLAHLRAVVERLESRSRPTPALTLIEGGRDGN